MRRPVILCFGDSNTWGFNPSTRERFPREVRWPGVLQSELGAAYHVIEEGLNGRTTLFDDPIMPGRCGKDYLLPCLESHRPIDLVILMLGTNDMKHRFSLTAYEIMRGAGLLLDLIRQNTTAEILLMSPPPLGRLTEFAEQFTGAPEKSRRLAGLYAEAAAARGCRCLDAGAHIRSSDVDGLHFEAASHVTLGRAVAAAVRTFLSPAP